MVVVNLGVWAERKWEPKNQKYHATDLQMRLLHLTPGVEEPTQGRSSLPAQTMLREGYLLDARMSGLEDANKMISSSVTHDRKSNLREHSAFDYCDGS